MRLIRPHEDIGELHLEAEDVQEELHAGTEVIADIIPGFQQIDKPAHESGPVAS